MMLFTPLELDFILSKNVVSFEKNLITEDQKNTLETWLKDSPKMKRPVE